MIVSMTSRIDELAEEAADPIEAGRKMRQVYFTHRKLTNRQLTVDLLKQGRDNLPILSTTRPKKSILANKDQLP